MQMLNIKQVAAQLGVCVRTAETMLAEGRLPRPVRFGRLRKWSEEQIDEWIVAEVARVGGSGSGTPGPGRGRPRSKWWSAMTSRIWRLSTSAQAPSTPDLFQQRPRDRARRAVAWSARNRLAVLGKRDAQIPRRAPGQARND